MVDPPAPNMMSARHVGRMSYAQILKPVQQMQGSSEQRCQMIPLRLCFGSREWMVTPLQDGIGIHRVVVGSQFL